MLMVLPSVVVTDSNWREPDCEFLALMPLVSRAHSCRLKNLVAPHSEPFAQELTGGTGSAGRFPVRSRPGRCRQRRGLWVSVRRGEVWDGASPDGFSRRTLADWIARSRSAGRRRARSDQPR